MSSGSAPSHADCPTDLEKADRQQIGLSSPFLQELSRVVLQDRNDEEELLEARSQEVGMASRSSHLVGSEEHSEEDDGPSPTGSEINEILDMEEDDPYAFTITD